MYSEDITVSNTIPFRVVFDIDYGGAASVIRNVQMGCAILVVAKDGSDDFKWSPRTFLKRRCRYIRTVGEQCGGKQRDKGKRTHEANDIKYHRVLHGCQMSQLAHLFYGAVLLSYISFLIRERKGRK